MHFLMSWAKQLVPFICLSTIIFLNPTQFLFPFSILQTFYLLFIYSPNHFRRIQILILRMFQKYRSLTANFPPADLYFDILIQFILQDLYSHYLSLIILFIYLGQHHILNHLRLIIYHYSYNSAIIFEDS